MRSLHTTKSGQAAVELAIFGSLILLALSVLLMYGQRLDNQQQVKMEAFRRALQKAYERNGNVTYTLKKEGRILNLFSGFGQGQASTVGSTAAVLWQKGMPGNQADSDDPDYGDRSEGFAYSAINDTEIGSGPDGKGQPRYPKRQIAINGKEVTVWASPSIYNEEQVRQEVYSGTLKKVETPSGGIVNTRIADLQDTLTTTPYVRLDIAKTDTRPGAVTPPNYVYQGGSYTNEKNDYTVASIPGVTLGAYYVEDDPEDNTKDNRIDYSPDKVGTTIHKERGWQTGY